MLPRLKWLVLGLPAILLLAALGLIFFGDASERAEIWEHEIEAFEQADAERFPEAGRVLFTGSSSIRLWSSLEADMAPLRVLNRGFGGAHLSHVNHYFDRIVAPYSPRAVVVYAGDNDVAAGKTAEKVEADFRALVERVHALDAAIPIYFLTIKASRLRWSLWPEMDAANDRIKALASNDPRIRVIDVSAPMVARGEGDAPPRALFRFDGLHLSDAGYALWTGIVKPRLLADLGPG